MASYFDIKKIITQISYGPTQNHSNSLPKSKHISPRTVHSSTMAIFCRAIQRGYLGLTKTELDCFDAYHRCHLRQITSIHMSRRISNDALYWLPLSMQPYQRIRSDNSVASVQRAIDSYFANFSVTSFRGRRRADITYGAPPPLTFCARSTADSGEHLPPSNTFPQEFQESLSCGKTHLQLFMHMYLCLVSYTTLCAYIMTAMINVYLHMLSSSR